MQSIRVTLTRRTDAHESNVQPPTPADAENAPPAHTLAPASARPSLVRIDPPRRDGELGPLHPPPASSIANAAPPPSEATDTAPVVATPALPLLRVDEPGALTPALQGELRPHYPPLSRRMGEEGLVVLRVRVLPSGRAGAVRVLRAPGSSRLVAAAIDAVRSARFTPAMRNGERTGAWLEIPIRFRIETR